MKSFLGNRISGLTQAEARRYANALLVSLEKTRGDRRITRELHSTLTHLYHLAN